MSVGLCVADVTDVAIYEYQMMSRGSFLAELYHLSLIFERHFPYIFSYIKNTKSLNICIPQVVPFINYNLLNN